MLRYFKSLPYTQELPFPGEDVILRGSPRLDDLGYRNVGQQVASFLVGGANLEATRSGVFESDYLPADADLSSLPASPLSNRYTPLDEAYTYIEEMHALIKERYEAKLALAEAQRAESANPTPPPVNTTSPLPTAPNPPDPPAK